MGFVRSKSLQNQIKHLKFKVAEYKKMASNVKEGKGKIDYSNRQETLNKLYELKGEVNTQIRLIDSTLSSGITNVAPTYAGATTTEHGNWASAKGNLKTLKMQLESIGKHTDFMTSIFENKKANTTHSIGELVEEVGSVSDNFGERQPGNPASDYLDVLSVVLVLVTILNKYKK